MIEWSGLRGWLQKVSELNELAIIKEIVDWDEEVAAITYLTGKTIGSPALLFEHIKDSMAGSSVLINILGSSLNRIVLTLGLPRPNSVLGLIEGAKDIFKRRIPPIVVEKGKAPINENLLF